LAPGDVVVESTAGGLEPAGAALLDARDAGLIIAVEQTGPNANLRSGGCSKHFSEWRPACDEHVDAEALGLCGTAYPLLVRLVPPCQARVLGEADLVKVVDLEVSGWSVTEVAQRVGPASGAGPKDEKQHSDTIRA